jgi:hypothetical protein
MNGVFNDMKQSTLKGEHENNAAEKDHLSTANNLNFKMEPQILPQSAVSMQLNDLSQYNAAMANRSLSYQRKIS